MPGKPITKKQVKLYMSNRKNPKQLQVTSAAKAGFSERTARRIDKGEHQVNHLPREYRTRKDPFKGLFEKHLVPLLEANPELQPITLLEVLDPSQNDTFNDHYLDMDLDLSQVMFICTANSMDIPPALLDRMEVIRLPGYTEEEKVNIAQKYLVPKAIKNNGLKEGEIEIVEAALHSIVRSYTREAGVRNLEREVNKICRKVVRGSVETHGARAPKKAERQLIVVDDKNIDDYLGVHQYDYGLAEEEPEIGRITGLAWTQVGGSKRWR